MACLATHQSRLSGPDERLEIVDQIVNVLDASEVDKAPLCRWSGAPCAHAREMKWMAWSVSVHEMHALKYTIYIADKPRKNAIIWAGLIGGARANVYFIQSINARADRLWYRFKSWL